MIRAFTLSVGQLGDPAILRVLALSLILTLAIFVGLGVALGYALDGVDPCGWLSDDDSCPLGGSASSFGAAMLSAALLWLLFPAVAIGVISGFMDRIVQAVEVRHYPEAAVAARPLGVAGAAWLGLRSSLRILLYNLIALPFYILLLVTGVGTAILFVVVNGLAFGRDLGDMVALRHLDRPARKAWVGATRGPRALLGMLVTALFLVPIANLLAPVLAAAMATHLFHQTRGGRSAVVA